MNLSFFKLTRRYQSDLSVEDIKAILLHKLSDQSIFTTPRYTGKITEKGFNVLVYSGRRPPVRIIATMTERFNRAELTIEYRETFGILVFICSSIFTLLALIPGKTFINGEEAGYLQRVFLGVVASIIFTLFFLALNLMSIFYLKSKTESELHLSNSHTY